MLLYSTYYSTPLVSSPIPQARYPKKQVVWASLHESQAKQIQEIYRYCEWKHWVYRRFKGTYYAQSRRIKKSVKNRLHTSDGSLYSNPLLYCTIMPTTSHRRHHPRPGGRHFDPVIMVRFPFTTAAAAASFWATQRSSSLQACMRRSWGYRLLPATSRCSFHHVTRKRLQGAYDYLTAMCITYAVVQLCTLICITTAVAPSRENNACPAMTSQSGVQHNPML